jgi:hypothetical protein
MCLSLLPTQLSMVHKVITSVIANTSIFSLKRVKDEYSKPLARHVDAFALTSVRIWKLQQEMVKVFISALETLNCHKSCLQLNDVYLHQKLLHVLHQNQEKNYYTLQKRNL